MIRRYAGSQEGFVQVMALLALGTISAVIVAAMSSANVSNLSSAALERLVQSDALITSGFRRLEAAVRDSGDDMEAQALRRDSQAKVRIDGYDISLQIEGVGGKIDPLATAPEVLSLYLSNSGISLDNQKALFASVEQAKHTANPGLAWNFLLTLMLGHLSAEDLGEDLTRYADHPGIDPAYASSRVINAIPDLSASDRIVLTNTTRGPGQTQVTVSSRYLAPNGTRFSLLVRVDWGQNQISERRLPVTLSSAGRLIALAGAG